jgi:hypothetical protein
VIRTARPWLALAAIAATAACAVEAPGAGERGRAGRGAEPAGPMFAAMLRSDSLVAPFAVYENGAWTAPAAGLTPELGVPLSAFRMGWFLRDGKPPALWTVRRPPGGLAVEPASLIIRTTGAPREARSHCQAYWAVPTSAPSEALTPGEPHRVTSAALSGMWPVVAPAILNPSAAEAARALAVVAPVFETAEASAVGARTGPDYEPRRTGAAAAKAPLAIRRLTDAGGTAMWHIYAFEARRTYARTGTRARGDCDEATIMTGWLAEDSSGRLTLLGHDVTLTDCDEKGATFIRPQGHADIGGRTWIFVVEHKWESETYAIYLAAETAITRAVGVAAGGC